MYESEEGQAKLAAMQENFLRRCQEVSKLENSQESASESDSELDVIVHEPEIVVETVKNVEITPPPESTVQSVKIDDFGKSQKKRFDEF